MDRLLVIQVAALGYEFLKRERGAEWDGLTFHPLEPVFPAVTCTAQASFRTAAAPATHGMVGNGFFDRRLRRAFFWEQSSALVEGPRIWDAFRARGGSVALLFWQQSLGEPAEIVLSPAPIHKHHGGMIQDCYSLPREMYATICERVGRPFDLKRYWGPSASTASSEWIAAATCSLLEDEIRAPDLCLTYLPALDYDLQRYGPDHGRSRKALTETMRQLDMLKAAAAANGYDILVFGDYAIEACAQGAVFLNRVLRENGWLSCRSVSGRLYADLHASRAFAVVDHQVAHVYVRNHPDIEAVEAVLRKVPGIELVLSGHELLEMGMAHPNAGDLVLLADDGAWFAYPWWDLAREAPDFASHVDIHQKPGYDPCELLRGWPPGRTGQDASRIRGTHGLVGPGRETAWASTFLTAGKSSLVDLAAQVKVRLETM